MPKALHSQSAQRAGRLSDHYARQRRPVKATVHDAKLIRCDGFGGTPFKSEPEREHSVVGVRMKRTGVLLSAEARYDHTTERVWDCIALNPVETPEGDQRWEEGARDLWSAVLSQADHTLMHMSNTSDADSSILYLTVSDDDPMFR